MRFRFPRLRRRGSAVPGGSFPPYQPDPDTVVVQTSMGGIGCQRCGETMPHPTGRPDADAIAWHQKHHCEPPGPIEEIGD